jgi:hypothetical protein
MALTRVKTDNFSANSITIDLVSGASPNPAITSIIITDSNYNNTENSTISASTGGYIKLVGFNFVSGCQVHVDDKLASSVTFISSTEVRAQLAAKTAGSYNIYLTNPAGKYTIKFNGITYA